MKKESSEKKTEKVIILNLEMLGKCERIKVEKYSLGLPPSVSRVAQRKRAGPITQRSMDRNHPLLGVLIFSSRKLKQFPLDKRHQERKKKKATRDDLMTILTLWASWDRNILFFLLQLSSEAYRIMASTT